jgi:hypothetical protein
LVKLENPDPCHGQAAVPEKPREQSKVRGLEQPQRDALQQFLTVFTSIQDQPITAGSRQSAVS